MGYEKITSAGLDRQAQCEHTFRTLMEAAYNRLCDEQGTVSVDERMVSTAFNRLMFIPIERLVELEAQLAKLTAEREAMASISKMLGDGWRVELEAFQSGIEATASWGQERHTIKGGYDLNAALAALVAAAGKEDS